MAILGDSEDIIVREAVPLMIALERAGFLLEAVQSPGGSHPESPAAVFEEAGYDVIAQAPWVLLVIAEVRERPGSPVERVESAAECSDPECSLVIFENGKPQDFIYLSVNHAFETLTGLTNVVGKSVTEVIPGIRETDQELFEIYGRVALTGKPERFETFIEALIARGGRGCDVRSASLAASAMSRRNGIGAREK